MHCVPISPLPTSPDLSLLLSLSHSLSFYQTLSPLSLSPPLSLYLFDWLKNLSGHGRLLLSWLNRSPPTSKPTNTIRDFFLKFHSTNKMSFSLTHSISLSLFLSHAHTHTHTHTYYLSFLTRFFLNTDWHSL